MGMLLTKPEASFEAAGNGVFSTSLRLKACNSLEIAGRDILTFL